MKRLLFFSRVLVTVATFFSAACATAQNHEDLHAHARLHAEKGIGKATYFPGYANLCDLEMTIRDVNLLKGGPRATRSTETQRPTRTRTAQNRSLPAMKVFDNLYFVGNQAVSSWLLGTEAGYILIDAMNTEEEAESIIEAGILTLGLDPTAIEYLLITHAHGDHFGGFEYFRDTYNPRIVMSDTDWQLADKLAEHPRFGSPPERDYTVFDGDQLKTGETTLDVYVTNAHTAGTISPVFTVYDKGVPYRAMLWGGTGFNFGYDVDRMNSYAASARRMKEVAEKENVRVFISNHGRRDGSIEKMAALAKRGSGDPHPFVLGTEVLDVFDLLEQCALAQADRFVQRDLESK